MQGVDAIHTQGMLQPLDHPLRANGLRGLQIHLLQRASPDPDPRQFPPLPRPQRRRRRRRPLPVHLLLDTKIN